jgi:hypothetical protein
MDEGEGGRINTGSWRVPHLAARSFSLDYTLIYTLSNVLSTSHLLCSMRCACIRYEIRRDQSLMRAFVSYAPFWEVRWKVSPSFDPLSRRVVPCPKSIGSRAQSAKYELTMKRGCDGYGLSDVTGLFGE